MITVHHWSTLQGTITYPLFKGTFEDNFPNFQRWDMLVSWRVLPPMKHEQKPPKKRKLLWHIPQNKLQRLDIKISPKKALFCYGNNLTHLRKFSKQNLNPIVSSHLPSGCFLLCYPQLIHFNRVSIINHPFWGTIILRNPHLPSSLL